jgi:hypothetical protein
MNVDDVTLINYIKKRYPKVVFTPLRLTTDSKPKNALGFVISDNKLVMGYITKNGTLCKLMEPVDLSELSHSQFIDLLSKIPLAVGFDEHDKQNLLNVLQDKEAVSSKEHQKAVEQIQRAIQSDFDIKYNMLIETNEAKNQNEILLIKKEYESKMDEIKEQYNKDIEEYKQKVKELQDAQETCKAKLLGEKEQIIQAIQNFRQQISDYIGQIAKNNGKDSEATVKLNQMYTQLLAEKTSIESSMSILTEQEKQHLKTIQDNESQLSEFTTKLNDKEQEVSKLNDTIKEIQNELDIVKKQFSEKELETVVLAEFKKNCLEQILNEKEQIIEKIKEYNSQWLEWAKNNNYNVEQQKDKLKNELDIIYKNLKKVLESKDKYLEDLGLTGKDKDIVLNKLKSNISDIKLEVNNSLNEQLTQLSLKNQELENSISESTEELKKRDSVVQDLRQQLEDVKKLLEKNGAANIPKEIDYNSCNETLQKFINVNNMFYRKKEVISILDGIINNPNKITSFTNLNDQMKSNIKTRFENVKQEINKHIDFLDLTKYVNSPNIQLFKSKTSMKNIPAEFCEELNNISSYWDNNVGIFREQDRILTNIYEDLSGAVRVYIKIKPLIGIEQKHKTVYIENHTKKVTVDCTNVPDVNKKETFGEFYGIFNDTYTNKDVYTGIEGSGDISELKIDTDTIEESNETISPGLYSTFKQVEDGYSIVLFGYGLSGSGKTYSLIGDKGVPGLLHYGLANLTGVSKIRVKYLFEQYIDKFVPTISKIRGRIINLVNEVPQMRNYANNEEKEFAQFINGQVNLNDIRVENINTLTGLLEKYRIEHSRIKKTPNNPVSSRSHLYMVFEVQFEGKDGLPGKVGYVTIVDTAGRESPLDIYNMFIDTTKRISLTTILGPTGGAGLVKQFMKEQYTDYDATNVFDILKEGFYINETINHLIYFFNKKNYRTTKIQKQISLEKYSNDKYYVDPRSEEDSIDGINNCLMIPILKFLDAISNRKQDSDDFKPTKFCVLLCVRKDEKYCNQIFSSLEFGQKIRST